MGKIRTRCMECRSNLTGAGLCNEDSNHFASPQQANNYRRYHADGARLTTLTAAVLDGHESGDNSFTRGGERVTHLDAIGRMCADQAIGAYLRLREFERLGR